MQGICVFISLSALAAPAFTQDPSFHARLRGQASVPGAKSSDLVAEGGVAYVGRANTNAIDVFDVSDPDQPVLLSTSLLPPPDEQSSTKDVQVGSVPLDRGRKLLFVGLEDDGNNGAAIFDVTNPLLPVLLTTISVAPGNYKDVHNLCYRDDGWLALCNSRTPTLALLDLRGYDPGAPPAAITSWTYELTGVGATYAHDCTFSADRLYVSAWDSLHVYDASRLDQGPPNFLGSVRELASHSSGSTDDQRFLASCSERLGGAVRLYEVLDTGTSVSLVQRDSFVNPGVGLGYSHTPHNPVFLGDRIYVSDYQAGVVVLQLDRVTKTLERVASYDTSAVTLSGFFGCWGVSARLGADRVLASDIENGLFAIDFSALQFTFPAPRPEIVPPFAAASFTFGIEEIGILGLDPATVELHPRLPPAGFGCVPCVALGGGLFEARLPAGGCGDRIDYFLSARDTTGEIYTSPSEAPAAWHTAFVSESLTTVLADDFEQDRGWTVTSDLTLTGGAWERAAPLDSGAMGGYDSDDAGNLCYVTQNGTPGASTNAFDVDGGPTRLESPLLDFSAGDGLVSYSRWFFSNADLGDALQVEVSSDGGLLYVPVEAVALKGGGWLRHTFRVSDHVLPTDRVRVRFSIADLPANSTTEAAIDDFRAQVFACVAPQAMAVFRNGSGVNPACYSATPPVLGSAWLGQVDTSAHPGTLFSAVTFQARGSSGTFLSGGELLLDPTSPRLGQSVKASSGGIDVHTVLVANNPSLVGLVTASQAFLVGTGSWWACNAFDLVAGY